MKADDEQARHEVLTMAWTAPNQTYPPPKPGEPALHRAAREGDHNAIKSLIEGGANVHATFDLALDPKSHPFEATPLMVSAGSGDGATAETVQLLLDLGADAKQVVCGYSAADVAARGLGWNYRPGGDHDRLALLTARSSPLNFSGRQGRRLVSEIARSADLARLRLLLDHGGSPNPIWDAGQAVVQAKEVTRQMAEFAEANPGVLAEADEPLRSELETSMKELHEELEAARAAAPYSFEIPLFEAAASGSAECVRLLLDRGADIRQLDNSCHTALFSAGSAEVVRELINAGVDTTHRGQFSIDALHEQISNLAQGESDDATIKNVCGALLDAGLPLIAPPRLNHNRLYDAAFKENHAAVRFLLELGHPVSNEDRSALHAICWHWDHGDERDQHIRDIISMLLAAGADPNQRDAYGNTPLHEAMSGDGTNLVAAEELLRAGADINARNSEGQTPLVYAYETLFDYAKIVPFLLARGANPLISNNRGRNAIDIARQMIAGENPDWRTEQWEGEGGSPCGWKSPAEEGDDEHRMLALLEEAAARLRS